jgi:hypothetical protein
MVVEIDRIQKSVAIGFTCKVQNHFVGETYLALLLGLLLALL